MAVALFCGRCGLPLIAPGVAAGGFLSFIASIDNVPVLLFLSNARTDMLPIRMCGRMHAPDVRVAAASGVLVTCAIVPILVTARGVNLCNRL